MNALITRQPAKISTSHDAGSIVSPHSGAAPQHPTQTATAQRQTSRSRFLIVLLHALSAPTV
jgi:hypothetical protein